MGDRTGALHAAVQAGRADQVGQLLTAGFKNFEDAAGDFTPLQWAADCGHADVCAQLVDAGANPNSAGPHPEAFTPLHLASWNGHAEVVKRLVALKADPRFVSDNQASPLHIACQEGHQDVIVVLMDAGASVNADDADGDRPLHLAACGNDKRGHHELVKTLLDRGANPVLRNSKNNRLAKLVTSDRQIRALLQQAETQWHADGRSENDLTAVQRLTQDDLPSHWKPEISALQPRPANLCGKQPTAVGKKRAGVPHQALPKKPKPELSPKLLAAASQAMEIELELSPEPPAPAVIRALPEPEPTPGVVVNLQAAQELAACAAAQVEWEKRHTETEAAVEKEEPTAIPELSANEVRCQELTKAVFKIVAGQSDQFESFQLEELLAQVNELRPELTAPYE